MTEWKPDYEHEDECRDHHNTENVETANDVAYEAGYYATEA